MEGLPMTIRKSISFTSQHDAWLKVQIASGQYGSESEVIRDLIRKEQKQESEIEAIRAALISGENSGVGKRTAQEIKTVVMNRLKDDAKLPAE